MPGAADAAVGHEPVGKRTVIMAAMGVDGEYLGPRAHQQNFLIADMAEQGLAVEIGRCNALCEIRPGGLGLLFSHVRSLRRRTRGPGRASPATSIGCPASETVPAPTAMPTNPLRLGLFRRRRGYSAAYFCASCSAAGGWPLDFRVWLQRASAFEKVSR